MNSILQCLSNTRALLDFCLGGTYMAQINTQTSNMKGAMIKGQTEVLINYQSICIIIIVCRWCLVPCMAAIQLSPSTAQNCNHTALCELGGLSRYGDIYLL